MGIIPGMRINSDLLLLGLKFTLAAIASLGISLWSSLPEPEWSVLTVACLANANTDQVTAKSLARAAGTLVGATVGLTLAALFAEQRVLFLLGLCIWLGLCQWMLMWFRDLEAYIFALSGYTAAIVGVPGALDPNSAADIAASRTSEVFIGIAATWVVSVVITPRFGYLNLSGNMRDAGEMLVACLSPGQKGAAARVKLANLFVNLHKFEHEISGQPNAHHRVLAVRSLNHGLMRNLFITRALSRPEFHHEEMSRLAAELPDALTSEEAARAAQQQWKAAAERLTEEITRIPGPGTSGQTRDEGARADNDGADRPPSGPAAPAGNPPPIYAAVPWLSFAAFCQQILLGFQALHNPSITPKPVSGPFHIAAGDAVMASVATIRAVLSVVVTSVFWLATEWSAGSSAVIIASIYPLLLVTPTGYRMIIWGVVIAIVPAMVISFQIVPHLTTFPLFALAISPFLMVCFMLIGMDGLYKMVGIQTMLLFLIPLDPDNVMTYDFAGALNSIVGLLLAFAACAVITQIVMPTGPWLQRVRLQRASARTLRQATVNSPAMAQRSQMRLTFLTSEIAPTFQGQKPDPFRETEAGYATGIAASAFILLYDGLTPDLPWAEDVRALRARMASFGLANWHRDLQEMIRLASQGIVSAEAAIAEDTDGKACKAAAAFRIIEHALECLSGLTLMDERREEAPQLQQKPEAAPAQ